MRAVDIIAKKKDAKELSREEIDFFISGYAKGEIPDYQAAAWAMAVLLNGMTPQETTDLTMAIVDSGERLDLSSVVPIAVDKHSTGGVGDKTTLVVAPTVASCGLPVGKMSGRGLGFSGGTLDKLESVPGYRTDLTKEEFMHQLAEVGVVVTGQTADLAPADGKLYALRDVTATVLSVPLIASSVMSKKIAGGAQAIVLDVKLGSGGLVPDLEQAKTLAELMVDIAHLAGRRAVALLSDMNQPLGSAVGNTLELCEAMDVLKGEKGKPIADFYEHCLVVSGHMLALGGIAESSEEGYEKAAAAIRDGRAWDRFVKFIAAQGGDIEYLQNPKKFKPADLIENVYATQSGFISQVNARTIGETAVILGAGRAKKEDSIDHAVGIQVFREVGDTVQEGDLLFRVHANKKEHLNEAIKQIDMAHQFSSTPVESLPKFYGVVTYEKDSG